MVSIVKKSIIILAVAAAFGGCALPNMPVFLGDDDLEGIFAKTPTDLQPIFKIDTVIVLLWDAPATPVDSYSVYWRALGFLAWNPLASGVLTTEYAVIRDDLKATAEFQGKELDFTGEGQELSFAVTSVYNNEESDIHSSDEAGWYINWGE